MPLSLAAPLRSLMLTAALIGTPALAIPPGATKDLPPPPKESTPDVATTAKADPVLKAAVANTDRPAADRARDVYRHPEDSLMFWGLKPGMTVIDLQPGGGYWTRILAPYLAATKGVYIAGLPDIADPKSSDEARKSRAAFQAKFAGKPGYGDVKATDFGPRSGPLATPDSVDLILTAREIHNWIPGGYLDRAMAQIFAALKPGGLLAVEDHRADPRPQVKDTLDGYVSTNTVVDAAVKAGFKLDGASEINANPKDTKNYPYGVWTLPPTRQSAPDDKPDDPKFDHAKYDAIGESDRMTLRFRKPVGGAAAPAK